MNLLQYSFVDSDGSVRIVKYTADSIHGFQAVVETIPPHVNTVPVAEIREAVMICHEISQYESKRSIQGGPSGQIGVLK